MTREELIQKYKGKRFILKSRMQTEFKISDFTNEENSKPIITWDLTQKTEMPQVCLKYFETGDWVEI